DRAMRQRIDRAARQRRRVAHRDGPVAHVDRRLDRRQQFADAAARPWHGRILPLSISPGTRRGGVVTATGSIPHPGPRVAARPRGWGAAGGPPVDTGARGSPRLAANPAGNPLDAGWDRAVTQSAQADFAAR